MYIKNIKLNNFRNYLTEEIELENGINIFYGNNAQGKTNILEAIYICAMGKSFRTKKEKEIINFNNEQAKIEINYEKKDRTGKINLDLNLKKIFYLNNIKLNKLSEILGNINIVMFSPDDINIIKSGPANRRHFLDVMISQLRPNYVYCMNQYIKTLEQRNNYLKKIKFENKSEEMLEIWDERLADLGVNINNYRNLFIKKIKNKINNIHSKITENKEIIKIKYINNCEEKQEYLNKLKKNRKIDIQNGYTGLGIHRDDFLVFINDNLVNVYGSQGQNRTVILSLKLAELEIIYEEIEEYPILLLDDFMSELDATRRKCLLENIKDAQVLITCTEKIELKNNYKLFKVNSGTITKEKKV